MTTQSEPKLSANTETLQLEFRGLLKLDPTLMKRYDLAVQSIFNVSNGRSEVHVDLRGLSPELAVANGDYLTIKEVSPYVIIASPEQAEAPLTSPLFSFEEDFLRKVNAKAGHIIETVTPHELLWGEMDNGLDFAHSIEDLLQVKTVSLRLDTPTQSMETIKRLQEMHMHLSEYLPDAQKVKEMIEMHRKLGLQKYGDIRGWNLNRTFPVEMDVPSFHTRLFGGTYVIRENDLAMILYGNKTYRPDRRRQGITYRHIEDPKIIQILEENRLVEYDFTPESLGTARQDIEDATLLKCGFDFYPDDQTASNPQLYDLNRNRGLAQFAHRLPMSWFELRELEDSASTSQIRRQSQNIELENPETKIKLAHARNGNKAIEHLLLSLGSRSADYVAFATIDPSGLLQQFESYPDNVKKYVCNQIARRENNGNI